jgi:hypothetical protein
MLCELLVIMRRNQFLPLCHRCFLRAVLLSSPLPVNINSVNWQA